jgi:hypothetical protein
MGLFFTYLFGFSCVLLLGALGMYFCLQQGVPAWALGGVGVGCWLMALHLNPETKRRSNQC